MNELLAQMNEIVEKLDVAIDTLDTEEEMVRNAIEKTYDLDAYLTGTDLLPNGFNADEMVDDIMVEYWENQEEVQEVADMLDELRIDSSNYLDEEEDEELREKIQDLSHDALKWHEMVRSCKEDSIQDVIEKIEEVKDELNDYIYDLE